MDEMIKTLLENFTLNIDFMSLLPEMIICGMALLTLLIEPFLRGEKKQIIMHLSCLTILAALISIYFVWQQRPDLSAIQFADAYRVDSYSLLFKAIFLVGSLLTVLISADFLKFKKVHDGSKIFVQNKLQEFILKLFVFPVEHIRAIILVCVLFGVIDWLVLFYGVFLLVRAILFFGRSYIGLKKIG